MARASARMVRDAYSCRSCGLGHTINEAGSYRRVQAVPRRTVDNPLLRRDGRVAEGARLESVFRGNSNVGSNPTLSAIQSELQRKLDVFLRKPSLIAAILLIFAAKRTRETSISSHAHLYFRVISP